MDEANTWIFYLLMSHGDVVRYVVFRRYMDESVDCVVGGRFGVVKCREACVS